MLGSENSVDLIIPSTLTLVTKALCSLNVIADGEIRHLGLFQIVQWQGTTFYFGLPRSIGKKQHQDRACSWSPFNLKISLIRQY